MKKILMTFAFVALLTACGNDGTNRNRNTYADAEVPVRT